MNRRTWIIGQRIIFWRTMHADTRSHSFTISYSHLYIHLLNSESFWTPYIIYMLYIYVYIYIYICIYIYIHIHYTVNSHMHNFCTMLYVYEMYVSISYSKCFSKYIHLQVNVRWLTASYNKYIFTKWTLWLWLRYIFGCNHVFEIHVYTCNVIALFPLFPMSF